jgi:hypothetical protein
VVLEGRLLILFGLFSGRGEEKGIAVGQYGRKSIVLEFWRIFAKVFASFPQQSCKSIINANESLLRRQSEGKKSKEGKNRDD